MLFTCKNEGKLLDVWPCLSNIWYASHYGNIFQFQKDVIDASSKSADVKKGILVFKEENEKVQIRIVDLLMASA